MSAPTPAQTLAILVGIEQYGGTIPPLNGPARDVVGWAKALRRLGVPRDRIMVRLAPIPKNRLWLQIAKKLAEDVSEQANWQALHTLIDKDLTRYVADPLLIIWAGHGMVTTPHDRRRLIAADATDDNLHNFDVADLLEALRSDRYLGLRRQMFVIEACANESGIPVRHIPNHELSKGRRENCEQWAFFAASPGEAAINRQGGFLSRELMGAYSELRGETKGGFLPDLQELDKVLRSRFEGLRATKQTNQRPASLWFANDYGPDFHTGHEVYAAQRSVLPNSLLTTLTAALKVVPNSTLTSCLARIRSNIALDAIPEAGPSGELLSLLAELAEFPPVKGVQGGRPPILLLFDTLLDEPMSSRGKASKLAARLARARADLAAHYNLPAVVPKIARLRNPGATPSVVVEIKQVKGSFSAWVADWRPWETPQQALQMGGLGRIQDGAEVVTALSREAIMADIWSDDKPIDSDLDSLSRAGPCRKPFRKIPTKIGKIPAEIGRRLARSGANLVEFVVPSPLLCEDFAGLWIRLIDEGEPMWLPARAEIVVRPWRRWDPQFRASAGGLIEDWQRRWKALLALNVVTPEWPDLSRHGAADRLCHMGLRDHGLIGFEAAPINGAHANKVNGLVLMTGIPVAIWAHGAIGSEPKLTGKQLLDQEVFRHPVTLDELRSRVHKLREIAGGTDAWHAGKVLSLFWDDPRRPPLALEEDLHSENVGG